MSDTAMPKEVIFYKDDNGKEPCKEWLYDLRDVKGRRRILRRMGKLANNIYGNCEPVGEGVSELRDFYGPGYRIYIGEHGNTIALLLGGDKDSQKRDIQKAKNYWKEYKNHEKP